MKEIVHSYFFFFFPVQNSTSVFLVLSQRSDEDLSSTIDSSSFGGTGGRVSILLFFEVQAHTGDESNCIIVFDVFDTEFLV